MSLVAGKYEIIRELGDGSGATQVFLVRHADLAVTLVLKLLAASLSSNDALIACFKSEAELLSRFNHPSAAQLRDFGRCEDGRYYMAQDLIEGVELSSYLREKGVLPITAALDIAIQLLDVLENAHAIGILHRALDPRNIKVAGIDATVRLWVLNFGMGSLRTYSDTGAVIDFGNPEYMAPEEFVGRATPNHRADLYSVGVILYELLSGRAPFRESTPEKTKLAQAIKIPPPIDPKRNVPLQLEHILARALAKEPDHRFQDAGVFRSELSQFRDLYHTEEPTTDRSPSSDAALTSNTIAIKPKTGAVDLGTRVLCIDDDPTMLQIVGHALARHGFHAYLAQSYSKVHDLIFSSELDALIVDVLMPGLDGPKICQMLKKVAPHLKIILFSSLPDQELIELAAQSGADGSINKLGGSEAWARCFKQLTRSTER